ncbi:hypothetical protein [Urbifossiella limnaea]|uniref:Uncharacterized protein n=1 Tax=Urbifossiella limnaea TaxID=2528023 RepID=A0A517XUS6_9BACT|nr:hypothetical protein [Urbifossiella limnaea]QDU21261.1 hypothetical protein ETAA1_32270 [Urbifossiella limnaea]
MTVHATTTAAAALPPPPDPFDVTRLALPDDSDADLGVRELLVSVPFRKPSKEQFFRVHPDPAYRCVGGLIELKDDDAESFWVDRSLWPALADEPTFTRRQVVTAVTRGGLVFVWGLRMPGPDGKIPDWVSIPQEAARVAAGQWTKLYWDQTQRRHRIRVSEHMTDAPTWPELPFPELLRLAFKDRTVTSLEHPVLKKLRGEV